MDMFYGQADLRSTLVKNPVGLIRAALEAVEARVFETGPPLPQDGKWQIANAEVMEVQALRGEPLCVPGETLFLLTHYPGEFVVIIQHQIGLEVKGSSLGVWASYVDRCVHGYSSSLRRCLLLLVLAMDAGDADAVARLLDWLDVVGVSDEVLLVRPTRSSVDLLDEVGW